MNDEETRRLRAYQIWESEGRPEGREPAHWYNADEAALDASRDQSHVIRYSPEAASPRSLVIKFYHSGDEIRGYVRKIADPGEDDAIFPGQEMEPDAAFKLADAHNGDSGKPVLIELVEGVLWDPSWGVLGGHSIEPISPETDDARGADGPVADGRRENLAREADKGLRRAIAETDKTIETTLPAQEARRGKN